MSEEQFYLIEAWLQGKLSPVEKAIFEDRVARDPALAQAVEQHRAERLAQELLVESDLMAKMKQWDRIGTSAAPILTATPTAAPPLRARRTGAVLMRWAAVFLLFGAAGWWFATQYNNNDDTIAQTTPAKPKTSAPKTTPRPVQPGTQPAPIPRPDRPDVSADPEDNRVADAPKRTITTPRAETPLPEPPPAPPKPEPTLDYAALADDLYHERDFVRPGSGIRSGDALYAQALDSYKSGRFGEVERLLRNNLKISPESQEVLAHALYRSGNYDDAFEQLRTLTNSRNTTIAQRSDWAMALTLLRQMPAKTTLLSRVLNKIASEPGHAFQSQAAALQQKLGL
jgi:hypothetical protein